jgi:hypothetical protein
MTTQFFFDVEIPPQLKKKYILIALKYKLV